MQKAFLTVAAVLFSLSALAQGPAPSGVPDASQGTQCWDVLRNQSRDKNQGEGKRQATQDYQGTMSSSTQDKKVQGPGAEPKDVTGVTTGKSVAADQKRGASQRPPGLPNC